jgi:hypothetical protein
MSGTKFGSDADPELLYSIHYAALTGPDVGDQIRFGCGSLADLHIMPHLQYDIIGGLNFISASVAHSDNFYSILDQTF